MDVMLYKIIDNLRGELLDNGFLSIPDYPSEDDLTPYRKIIATYRQSLLNEFSVFLNDLLNGKETVNYVNDIVEIEDMDAQGVTMWTFLFDIIIQGKMFRLKINCLIFQNSIQCFLVDSSNSTQGIEDKKGLSKGIQLLLDKMVSGYPVQLQSLVY